jgi:hypothetical protein
VRVFAHDLVHSLVTGGGHRPYPTSPGTLTLVPLRVRVLAADGSVVDVCDVESWSVVVGADDRGGCRELVFVVRLAGGSPCG